MLRGCLGVLAIAMSLMATAQDPDPPPARGAILIGASYAEGWRSPSLPGLQVVNKGRTGEETGQLLARFDKDVISERPDVVIIWGHINDIFRAPNGDMAAAAQKAMRNLEEMVGSAQRAGIRVIVATEVTLREPRGLSNWVASIIGRMLGKVSYQTRVNVHVREVNEFLRDLAGREQLTLLDFERALSDESGERRSEFARDDGSHITENGYEALTAYASAQLAARR